jgi:hypothetical protein
VYYHVNVKYLFSFACFDPPSLKSTLGPRSRSYIRLGMVLSVMLMVSAGPIAASAASNFQKSQGANDSSTLQAVSLKYPVGTVFEQDPTGMYIFAKVADRLYSINYSGYQEILNDPYQRLSGSVSISGQMVFITVPKAEGNLSVQVSSSNWAGVGTGYCSSYSIKSGFAFCNSPYNSVGQNLVETSSLSWLSQCGGGVTYCHTAFWGGISQQSSGSGVLVQNGVNCYGKSLQCYAIYEIAPSQGPQTYTTQPSVWSGVSYTIKTYIYSSGTAGFWESIGSTILYTTENLPSGTAVSSFVQAEGIMESPCALGVCPEYFGWTSDQYLGNICDLNGVNCAGYTQGPNVLYYNYSPTTNNLKAYGSTSSNGLFSITYTGQG